MSNPTITCSVVIPSFNQGQFIDQTIRSVLDQRLPSHVQLELIVIDGGSTDETIEIIKSYEQHLLYWVSEPDRGQTHAINKGMAQATGEIRAYLNSDDLYLPGAFEAVVEAYHSNPGADIFHGRCITIDEDDRRLDREFFSDIETPSDVLDLWQVWFKGRNFVQPEVFWTRRIAEKVGPFDENRHYAMDYDYWTRCIIAGANVHHIDQEVSAFRIWAAQKSSAAQKAADELREIAIEHLRDKSVDLPGAMRRQLIGDWAFDERYSKRTGDDDMSAKSSTARKISLAGLLFRHPELFYSRSFRRHASKIVSRWAGAQRA